MSAALAPTDASSADDASMQVEATTILASAAVAAPAMPTIDRFVRADLQFAIPPRDAYLRAYERAVQRSQEDEQEDASSSRTSSCASMLDEYNKFVRYSPDGLCLLVCSETGGGGGQLRSQVHTRRPAMPARKKPRHTAAPNETEECKAGGETTTTTAAAAASRSSLANGSESESSSSSSSDDSSSSESDDNDAVSPLDPSDRRGLSMFELPPMRWQQPASVDSAVVAAASSVASSYVYDVPPSAAAADPSSTGSIAPPRHTTPSLRCHPGDSVYAACWHPLMHSSDPASCFFLSTARSNPIHSWSAYTGRLLATWSGIDQMDELEPAISLCMAPPSAVAQQGRIFAGYNKSIRIFDVERPGRECTRLATWKKQAKQAGGKRGSRGRSTASSASSSLSQSGLISSMAINPVHASILAAGSYNGELGLYNLDAADGGGGSSGLEHKLFLDSHGVSQVAFSPDGLYLFASIRHAAHILVYDMRACTSPVSRLHRANRTNQRLEFDVDQACGGRFLACGDSDGHLLTFDLTVAPDETTLVIPPAMVQRVARDALCGVTMHPQFSSTVPLIATCSGERQLFMSGEAPTTAGGRPAFDDASTTTTTEAASKASPNEPSSTAGASALPLNTVAVFNLQHTIAAFDAENAMTLEATAVSVDAMATTQPMQI